MATTTSAARWVRPRSAGDDPVWGHVAGLQVGLPPLPGPRGLLRVYAPYLGHPAGRVVNYVAVEPVPAGSTARGYSELEHSVLDGVQGKRFRAAEPFRGQVEQVHGVEELRVTVDVERFDNGAHVGVEVVFRADRPHEVGLAAMARDDSAPLDVCVLSATMGNFARLRRLHLADEVVEAAALWPDFAGEHFTDHAAFGLDRLRRGAGGDVVVGAATDEAHDGTATYAEGTAEHWRYLGQVAVQQWRADDPDPRLRAQVNGRHRFWASTSVIPGGTAFENFELVEPFRSGRRLWFGVRPVPGQGG